MTQVKKYDAIIFDLFSTVAIWQADRLPLFQWRGKTSHSTMGILQHSVETLVAEASFETFVDALDSANEKLSARRAAEMKEIPSVERFALALTIAGYPASQQTNDLAQVLSLKHMELLASAVEIPQAHVDFLSKIHTRYPLALLSNFDHGPTARAILARDGAANFFDPIVISDEHGWRKPHANIFADTLETLHVEAKNALYVGDSVEDDIVGAKGAGLDIAWVNARGADLPEQSLKPDYVISAIPDLSVILLNG